MPLESLPARGAWIEIDFLDNLGLLKGGRSPRGERGLKLPGLAGGPAPLPSLPARGAWIEMVFTACWKRLPAVAPREGSVD